MTAGYFTRTYEWWRYVDTTDPIGQPIKTWSKLDDIPGRAWPQRVTDVDVQDLHAHKVHWRFACGPDVALQPGDEIRFDNHRLEVRGWAPTSSGNRIEAECEEDQT